MASDPTTLTPFGHLASVSLEAIEAIEEELHPEERLHATTLGARRKVTWTGGRVALRRALRPLGVICPAIRADDRGAPVLPDFVRGSIAHKDGVAVALARGGGDAVGVDVEYLASGRVDISARVLTDRELDALAGLDADARAGVVRVAFAIKEAIYKAIDPVCRRYVGFREVSLDVSRCASPSDDVPVTLGLSPEAPCALTVRAAWILLGPGCVVAMASASKIAGWDT